MNRKISKLSKLVIIGACIVLVGCDKENVAKKTEVTSKMEEQIIEETTVVGYSDEELEERKGLSVLEINSAIKRYWSDLMDEGLKWKYTNSYGCKAMEKNFPLKKYKIGMRVSQSETDKIAGGMMYISNPQKIEIEKIAVKGKRDIVDYNSTEAYTNCWDEQKNVYWTIWSNEASNKQKEKYERLKLILNSGEGFTVVIKRDETYKIKGEEVRTSMIELTYLIDEMMTYY